MPLLPAGQVIGDMLVYPNRMTFDIMPNGGNPPEPTGMLVVRIKSVSDIKGGHELFSKVGCRTASRAPLAVREFGCVHTNQELLPARVRQCAG